MSDSSFDLRRLRIASPCSERWEGMSGDARVRFCAKCQLNVFNVAELAAAEVEALILKSEGRVCGRLYRRSDGTVLTRDCPVGLRKARMKVAAALTAMVALVLAVIGSVRTHARDAAVFVDDTPASTSAFWTKVKVRAVALEDQAREVPVIGPLIERLDPAPPPPVAGKMIMIPPTAPSKS